MKNQYETDVLSNSMSDGRLPVIRGTLQWVVALLVVMNLFLSVSLLVGSTYAVRAITALGLKPPLVYVVGPNGTTPTDGSSLLHTGPQDVELQGVAWDVVRFIAAADSTNAIFSFQQAKQLMTAECRKAFEREVEPAAKELMDLKIYRVLEAEPIRLLKHAYGSEKVDDQSSSDRYDLVVSGTLKTYRIGSNEVLTNGRFSYRVQMVPTQRSVSNSRGILVSRISPISGTKGESYASTQK